MTSSTSSPPPTPLSPLEGLQSRARRSENDSFISIDDDLATLASSPLASEPHHAPPLCDPALSAMLTSHLTFGPLSTVSLGSPFSFVGIHSADDGAPASPQASPSADAAVPWEYSEPFSPRGSFLDMRPSPHPALIMLPCLGAREERWQSLSNPDQSATTATTQEDMKRLRTKRVSDTAASQMRACTISD